MCVCVVFFFQAEDGIRDLVRSRGLGDVYKRQVIWRPSKLQRVARLGAAIESRTTNFGGGPLSASPAGAASGSVAALAGVLATPKGV